MSNNSWITKSQLEVAYAEGLKILNYFDRAFDGEQSWTEIEIDGKFFDIECYQEEEQDDVVCNIYPTYPTNCGTWRETDGTKWVRLFTKKPSDK